MKKLFISTLVLMTSLIVSTDIANAVEYEYNVYNPYTKTTTRAQLGTIGVNAEQEYVFAFFTPEGKPLCIHNNGTEKELSTGKIGGSCSENDTFKRKVFDGETNLSVIQYTWSEVSRNTFYKELVGLVHERAKQGRFMY